MQTIDDDDAKTDSRDAEACARVAEMAAWYATHITRKATKTMADQLQELAVRLAAEEESDDQER